MYDNVYLDDFRNYLDNAEENCFDAVVASESLMFIKDLVPVLEKIEKVLNSGQILVFSVKTDKRMSEDFYFDTYMENFVFSNSYLNKMIEKSNMELIESVDINFPGGDTGRIIMMKSK